MIPFYESGPATVYQGDCIDVMRELPDASVDAVVTDPPYGISFMGKQWDQPGQFGSTSRRGGGPNLRRGEADAALEAGRYDLSPSAMRNFQGWCEAWASECFRVLKPGGHLLAFGGSRTWHRLAAGVEDAGFEIRDSIAWLYGSGFPKSLDVSKAIDKHLGAERAKVHKPGAASAYAANAGNERPWMQKAREQGFIEVDGDEPATAAAAWDGWGTALKPSFEPIVVARKPLSGTVAQNVLTYGAGALNVGATRVGSETLQAVTRGVSKIGTFDGAEGNVTPERSGRWPANVVLDEGAAAEVDRQSGASVSRGGSPREASSGVGWGMTRTGAEYDDEGGASRFFPTFRYEAKASTAERPRQGGVSHPTVKPLGLIRWLCRLVTPPGGKIVDLFGGSGTTAEAALMEGFEVIVIEREADYLPLIMSRLSKPIEQTLDMDGAA